MQRLPTEIRQQQIAEAALTIIARDGLGRFTTSAIAKETALAEGTIFRHFANKEAIVDAAIGQLESLMAPEPDPGGEHDPMLALRAFLAGRLELLKRKPGYLRILLSSELEHAAFAEVRPRVMAIRERSIGRVVALVERAAAAGLVRRDVAPQAIVMVIHGVLMAMVFNGDVLKNRLGFEVDFDHLWANLVALITAAPEAPLP